MSFTFDPEQGTIGNGRIEYRYGHGYLHNGEGTSIVSFVDATADEEYAYGFDGQYRDGSWDGTPVTFGAPREGDGYVDVPVRTGHTTKIDRLHRDAPVLEIIYSRNESEWTEDFIRGPGPTDHLAFVMHGMEDVVGLEAGRRLWRQAEARYGHNHGDHFLSVAGSSVARCTHHGHFIYGIVSLVTGHGVGFVYPVWITTHDWKVWWTEERKIEIEYAPGGKPGRRWIFPVTEGKAEVLEVGQRLARRGPRE
jgi:hypothetical protein